MDSLRILNVLSLVGIGIGLAGSVLPCGEYMYSWGNVFCFGFCGYPRNPIPSQAYLAAFFLTWACISQAIFMTSRKQYTMFLTLVCASITVWAAMDWLSQVTVSQVHGYWFNPYTILYGAYVTLAGSLVASSGTILSLTLRAERVLKTEVRDLSIGENRSI